MLTLFRGMVGDMDYGEIYDAEKQLGPFLYMIYLSTTAFVAFNILIAVISDSYDAVKDSPERDGVTVSAFHFLQRKFYKTTGIDEEEDQGDGEEDDVNAQLAALTESNEAMRSQLNNLTEMMRSLHEQSQAQLSGPSHKEPAIQPAEQKSGDVPTSQQNPVHQKPWLDSPNENHSGGPPEEGAVTSL